MVVQGYVSLQKSIGSLAEHKAALTWAPWDKATTSGSGSKKPLQSDGYSAFGSISHLCADPTVLPFYAFKYSLSARFSWRARRARFDVFHLSLLRNWGIWWDLHNMKYSWVFWMAIKRTTERLGLCRERCHASPTVHEKSTSACRYEQTVYEMEQLFNVGKAQNYQWSRSMGCCR